MITGAYGAIGKAITEGIASLPASRIWMLGRDPQQLEKAGEEIQKKYPRTKVTIFPLELSLQSEILRFSAAFGEPLDVLVNNAATTPRRRETSEEGVEMQWAVNVLAYFRLIRALLPRLQSAPSPRIVNVASYWAGGLDLDDPEFIRRPYNNDQAYRQSKQSNRMMTAGLAVLPDFSNISINACHPGDVNSKLSNQLGFGGSESPDQGAATPLFLATSTEVTGVSGKYFESRRPKTCEFSGNHNQIQELMDLIESYG